MANNLLPMRMGELFRAYFLKEKKDVSGSSALATILVERVCDGLTLVLVLTVVLALFPQEGWVHTVGWIAGAVFLPGFIGTFQYAFVLSFGLLGIAKETAIAVSIATQLVFFSIVNPVGIGLLWKHNLSLRRVQ